MAKGNFSPKKKSTRREEVLLMKQSGMTYQNISELLGISRQRVGQLVGMTAKERKEFIKTHNNRCDNCGASEGLSIHHGNYTDKDSVFLLCDKCHTEEDMKLGRRKKKTREITPRKKLPATNTSGYRGIVFHSNTGTWTAKLHFQGRIIYCGKYFKTPIEAARAYDALAKKHRKEKAILNFT